MKQKGFNYDDELQLGRCPRCGEWSKSSYMTPKDRDECSDDSYICDTCYAELWENM